MTQMVRRMFLVHAAVISAATQAVDLVMQDHAVSDIHRAVIRHFPVLDEEDIAALRLRPWRKTYKPFISIVMVENVIITRVP